MILDMQNEIPLSCTDRAKYRGMAYDGCSLYLTKVYEPEIIQLNPDTMERRCFHTCRKYSCICWDSNLCCFWAGSDQCPSAVFKLTCDFCEIDCVYLKRCDCHAECLMLNGISYNCCERQLLLACRSGIFTVGTDISGSARVSMTCCHECCTAVLSMCPYYLSVCSPCDKNQTLCICGCDETKHCMEIPGELRLLAAALTKYSEDYCQIYILAARNCHYPVLLKCHLECSELCPPLCPCNCIIPCNSCPDCCCRSKCAGADLLESVALMEAALSHILNAEGEKLQKAIACTDDIGKLLEINKAVNSTLISATHMEQVLYQKLEIINEVCPQPENCDTPCIGDIPTITECETKAHL